MIRFSCTHLVLMGWCILLLVSFSVSFSLSESYENFVNANGVPYNRYGGFPNNMQPNNRIPFPSNGGLSGILNNNNGDSESEESSLESVESNEDSKAQVITPSPRVPQSTYFVTATRYQSPQQENNMDNEAQESSSSSSSTEFPQTFTKNPDDLQQVDESMNENEESDNLAPPLEDIVEETTTPTQEVITIKDFSSEESLEPTPTLTNELTQEEEKKLMMKDENLNIPLEEEDAELVEEPIPTPMALISSNGEGSNPPLEEEFSEAFKKVGPNGKRRRVRPGGGRRRVRMRVKKLKNGSREAEQVISAEETENDAPSVTIRPRRYRSTTTTAPERSLSSIAQDPTSSSNIIQLLGPKPLIISDIQTESKGNSGLNPVPSDEPLQQMEKPNNNVGFTEQINTYFFTPPPRISTTIIPKIIDNESTSISGEDSKPLESQVQSSRAFKSHLWDTTISTLNEITSTPTEATKNEPEKSESVRKTVQSPIMENRSYSVHPDEDYESAGIIIGRNSFASPPPFLDESNAQIQTVDNFKNGNLDFNQVVESGSNNPENMPHSYFTAASPYNRFENDNVQFPPSTFEDSQRSHYDKTKDPFFTNNQFFKNANPFPQTHEQVEFNPSLEHQHQQSQSNGPMNMIENQPIQPPVFDHNGFDNSGSPPMSEQFYAPNNVDEQTQLNAPNDYGQNTHYIPTDFKSSPVDPVAVKGVGSKRRGRKKKRPSFRNMNLNNNNDSPAQPDQTSGLLQNFPETQQSQQQFDNNNILNHGQENLNLQQQLQNNQEGGGLGYPQNLERPIEVPFHYHPIPHGNEIKTEYSHHEGHPESGMRSNNNVSPIPNFTEPSYNNEISNSFPSQDPTFTGGGAHNIPQNGPNPHDMQRFLSQQGENPAFSFNPQNRPPMMMHRPPFFRNNIPPQMQMSQHSRFNVPQPNTPFYSVTSLHGFDGGMNNDGSQGRPPPNFHNTSPLVNMPMPGLNNIPPPPSEQQALSEVQPTHHFPPHTHSMSNKPDYEPANPPLPPGHPMDPMINFGNHQYGTDLGNHIDDNQQHHFSNHNSQEPPLHFDPPKHIPQSSPPPFIDNHDHHESSPNNNHHDNPGFDILSAYYDKPPPTVGTEFEHSNRLPEHHHEVHENETPNKVPYQYTSSDGGGLDGNSPFSSPNGNRDPPKDSGSKANEEKNITAMYSDTPYVLMFPQLVSEEQMIPSPPKILTREIPVVQASSMAMSESSYSTDGKQALGPGLKAVAVHPRHQMYQVLAKAHYDKTLQNYIESRKKTPSAIYTPYGILVPMGPSTAASMNHEKYANNPDSQNHEYSEHQYHKDPHERQLLHLLLGKKSPLGHFHLLKHSSIKNGKLKNYFDFKANVDPALELLAEKLALKLSTAKYILSAPAKLGLKAFSKHAASYSEHKPVVIHPTPQTLNSLALGSELSELLAASRAPHESRNVKGENVDPDLKFELKRLLKDRLAEILIETEKTEIEKEHLAAMASNAAHMKVPFPAIGYKPEWSGYFSPPKEGLIGTIKRLFFGTPSAYNEKPADSDSFGFLNSVGRMGVPASRNERADRLKRMNHSRVHSQKRIKNQLEKWLDIVLTTSDMSTSESVVKPVYVKYPGSSTSSNAGGRLGKSVGNSLSTFSLKKPVTSPSKSSLSSLTLSNLGLTHKLGPSVVPSNFLSSSWKPIMSSAFKSVFNYPSAKTSSRAVSNNA